jgi:hypothetical protein
MGTPRSSADVQKPVLSAEEAVDLQRRRISVAAAMALLGGATVTLTGCSGGGSPAGPSPPVAAPPPSPPEPSGCPAGSVCGEVDTDSLHSAVITGAQLAAGGALVLNIRGTQTHGHLVELTAEELAAIGGGQRVQKTSSFNLLHQHQVTFN